MDKKIGRIEADVLWINAVIATTIYLQETGQE